jgi:hypothetical protein
MLTFSVYLLASTATAVNNDHKMFIRFACRKYLLSIFIFFHIKVEERMFVPARGRCHKTFFFLTHGWTKLARVIVS